MIHAGIKIADFIDMVQRKTELWEALYHVKKAPKIANKQGRVGYGTDGTDDDDVRDRDRGGKKFRKNQNRKGNKGKKHYKGKAYYQDLETASGFGQSDDNNGSDNGSAHSSYDLDQYGI
ncbi:hypothetical protein TWF481_002985 [Arthrobotrys musiformis]|uniref:Uncharacterized protein n=1 Tax=Arthrobotrys musiformis TaxID=47236 RepID=A0AAV9VXY6_9PEZI